MIRRRDLLLAGLIAPAHRLFALGKSFLTSNAIATSFLTSEIVRPTSATQIEGVVTVTMSKDGRWAYVTMPSATGQEVVRIALVLQFGDVAPQAIEFSGDGKLTYFTYGIPAGVLAVEVAPTSGGGWIFALDTYGGVIPSSLRQVNAVGIARYSWSDKAESPPTTHSEFVAQMTPASGCQQCPGTCESGGPGSAYCGYVCGGRTCNIICPSGWFACCFCCNNTPNCHCCS